MGYQVILQACCCYFYNFAFFTVCRIKLIAVFIYAVCWMLDSLKLKRKVTNGSAMFSPASSPTEVGNGS